MTLFDRSTASRISLQLAGLLLVAFLAALLAAGYIARQLTIPVIICLFISLAPAGMAIYAARALYRAGRLRLAGAWAIISVALACAAPGNLLPLVVPAGGQALFDPAAECLIPLAACPAFLLGVLLLPAHEQTHNERLKMVLDLAIVLIAWVLVDWDSLAGLAGLFTHASPWEAAEKGAVAACGDILIILAVFWLLYHHYRPDQRRPALLLAGGGSLLVFHHLLDRFALRAGGAPSGVVIESVHMASSLFFILAGLAVLMDLQASAPEESDDPVSESMVANWYYYLPYLFVLSAYGLLLQRNFISTRLSMLALTLAFGGIITLVLLRQFLSLRENRQLFQGLNEAHLKLQQQTTALERMNQEMQQEIVERRRAEDRLSYDAMHDGLTGLPNRALFLDRLEQACRKKARNPAYQYAVLFLDLDSFKLMNGSLGCPAVDQILMRIAQDLQGYVRGTDTVARVSEDEFAILLEDVGYPEDVVLTAKRLLAELNRPVLIGDKRLFVSASIGIVAGNEIHGEPEEILRDADLALYQAKLQGKGGYVLFHDTMRETAISHMTLESDLRAALENHQFTLWYQPIIELPNNLVGFEALVRWQHPTRGLIAPTEFIPLAEATGLILPLGRWILETACRQAVEWIEIFPELANMKMGVNISGLQISQPDFVHSVVEVLQETRLSPECLALEVTESVCLGGLEQIADTLNDLQALGIEVQIDDFGTGYSSLSYLQRLPVYTIKIDRSFIRSLTEPGASPDIVRAIFSMVNHLGIKAVAEGIENEAQLEALQQLNCRYVQGYLLARPMEPDHAACWMLKNGH